MAMRQQHGAVYTSEAYEEESNIPQTVTMVTIHTNLEVSVDWLGSNWMWLFTRQSFSFLKTSQS